MQLEDIDTGLAPTAPQTAPAKKPGFTAAISVAEFVAGLHLPASFTPHVDVGLAEAQDGIRFAWVDPATVYIDLPHYARRPDEHKLRFYGAHFNVLLTNAIVLNERTSGDLFVLDGAHRCCTAVLTGIELLPAIIYKHLEPEQEAWLAGHLNRDVKRLSPIEMFHMLLFGRDQASLRIRDVVEAEGLAVARKGEGGSGQNAIDAIDALRRIDSYDPSGALLQHTLRTIRAAWPDQKPGLRSSVLGAVAIILRALPDKPRQARLIKKMAEIGHKELATRVTFTARADTTAGWVEALLWAFNHRLAKSHHLVLDGGAASRSMRQSVVVDGVAIEDDDDTAEESLD